MENEKAELIYYFVFAAERFTHAMGGGGGLIIALIFLLRNVTYSFIVLLRAHTLRRQLVPKRRNWEN